MTTFFNYLRDEGLESQVSHLIRHMESEIVTQCAESSLSSPREFWRMINILTNGFELLHTDSSIFAVWLQFCIQYTVVLINVATIQYDNNNNHNIEIIDENNENKNSNNNNNNNNNNNRNNLSIEQQQVQQGKQNERNLSNGIDILFEMFLDYGFTCFLHLLKYQASKRYSILSFIIQFVGHNSEQHITFLKKLRTEIDDINIFIPICTVLLRVCVNSDERKLNSLINLNNCSKNDKNEKNTDSVTVLIDDQLMDIYGYYGIYGISQQSPKIRASSLNILSDLLANVDGNDGLDIIVPYFESKIMSMAVTMNDDWWEIQSELIILCCNLLSKFNSNHEIAPLVYNTLIFLLNNESNQLCCKSIKIAISHLSNPMCIVGHKIIYDVYANLLLNKMQISQLMLNKSFNQSIIFSSGVTYHMQCISNYCKGWIVCQVIAQQLKTQRLGNFLPQHLQLVLAAINQTDEFVIQDVEEWKQVFIDLKDYLLVELCDPDSCDMVVKCLEKFLNDRNIVDQAIKLLHINDPNDEIPALFGVLKLLYPNGPQMCQETLFSLLQNLINKVTICQSSKNANSNQIIERLSQAAISLLITFYNKCPIQFSQSMLATFKPFLKINQDSNPNQISN